MLTHEEIKNLTDYQLEVFKDAFVTKDEFKEESEKLNKKVDLLTNAVDSFAKEALKNSQEITVMTNRMAKMEANLKRVADKVGVVLEN